MKSKPKTIGYIGGGQLALMSIYRTKKFGLKTVVLDPDAQAPAGVLADVFLQGSLYDSARLRTLAQACDLITYDIEHTDTECLKVLEGEGVLIYPSPQVLEVIQDKYLQKELYHRHGIPQSSYGLRGEEEWRNLPPDAFPVVQKLRKGGYDGRGVQVLKDPRDLVKVLKGETFWEEWVDFEKELAVMVVRSAAGETAVYPVVEMVFDPLLNICDTVVAPAQLTEALYREAQSVALKTVEALGGVGIFGVELFLTKGGEILVNETAPRPHNSGHYTMESCAVCQYENHLRAILGWPLGTTEMLLPSVMVNLLGKGQGLARFQGLEEALKVPGFSLHMYGKAECRPGRKMGHFTVTAPTREAALTAAQKVKSILSIEGA